VVVQADPGKVAAVSERLQHQLTAGVWDTSAVDEDEQVRAAAEIANFALGLSGKRKAARRGGRLSRLVVHFALAATVALSLVVAACGPDNSSTPAVDVASLASASATDVTVAAPTRGSPGRIVDLVLLEPGTDANPWAVLVPRANLTQSNPAPVLVDMVGSDLQAVGGIYSLPAQPVGLGTRDGSSQFLDPLGSATQTGSIQAGDASIQAVTEQVQSWQRDERYQAATRAIAGRPNVLDAAYNAEAAVAAGGTHTYLNGVVLRVDPDNPALQVIDRALLESGTPTRAEDLVLVAIRPEERSLYEPGSVVNLRDVVMDKQQSTVNDQPATFYVANAALSGARVEPTGERVDLQNLLQTRLQRTDADLAVQADELSGTPVAAAATPTLRPAQPPVVVNRYSGPSFVDDFLIWMWLTNGGFYRGPNVVVVNPPPSPRRPSGDYYYTPPASPAASGSASPAGAAQTTSRSTALQSARNAISGQGSGTGGGTAATAKAASESSARVSAATAKAASVAGGVSSASAGKSVSVSSSSGGAPSGSSGGGSSGSSSAARSAGSVSAGARGSASSSGSSGSGGRVGASSSGGFGSSGGGKGISGSGSS
jgi:hypothetical protein